MRYVWLENKIYDPGLKDILQLSTFKEKITEWKIKNGLII